MRFLLWSVVNVAVVGLTVAASSPIAVDASQNNPVTIIPAKLDKSCRGGRAKLYDECSDQWRIFETAAKRAATENKIMLVSYGAEWCIWCHVFAKYIHGEKTRFNYTYGTPAEPEARYSSTIYEREKRDVGAEAASLNAYVARSFVVVHIESHYANGYDVLERTGAAPFAGTGIPFIFTVNRQGRYATTFDYKTVEVRRDTDDWYRGYDRSKLMAELERMHAAGSR